MTYDDVVAALESLADEKLRAFNARIMYTRMRVVFIKPRSGGECERPAGEWNCAEIVCVGDHIAVCVNGVLQNECTGSVRSGYIALQSEGGPVEFRNIWLTRLRRGI